MSNRAEWVWMPHPGHFICSRDCRFHLNTYVGDFIVSTVGEYEPDEGVREALAESRGIKLEGRGDDRRADWLNKHGYEEIGIGRTYETLVFVSEKSRDACCPFTAATWSEVTGRGYDDAKSARRGHEELCEEYSTRSV